MAQDGGLTQGSIRRLLFFLLVNLQCVLGNSNVFPNAPRIHPPGLVLLPIGTPIDLYCEDVQSDNLEFSLGGRMLLSERINSTTIRLNTSWDKGVYTVICSNKDTKKKSIRILVDGPPSNVTDFQCKSYNLDVLNCTWNVSESPTILNQIYSLYIVTEKGIITEPCKPTRTRRTTRTCTWSHTTIPRYRVMDETYFFTLRVNNVFGSNEQNFTIDHYSVVQPAPVVDLRVSDVGVYSALLQWRLPYNVIDLLPGGVTHKIEYRVNNIDNSSNYRSVDTSSLSNKQNKYNISLSLPYAGMQYEVRISIRPVKATDEQFWSMPSVVTFHTQGKSISEINSLIYNSWRKKMTKVDPSFGSKTWHMKAQKDFYGVWQGKKFGPMSLLYDLMGDSNRKVLN